jgi:hypothetical protein
MAQDKQDRRTKEELELEKLRLDVEAGRSVAALREMVAKLIRENASTILDALKEKARAGTAASDADSDAADAEAAEHYARAAETASHNLRVLAEAYEVAARAGLPEEAARIKGLLQRALDEAEAEDDDGGDEEESQDKQ